jgi:hypothetical protein
LCAAALPFAIELEGIANGIEQILVAKWFGEKFDGAVLYGTYRHRSVTVRRDKDDRNLAVTLGEALLQVGAAEAGHSHVENETSAIETPLVAQEFLGRAESFYIQPDRSQQIPQRISYRNIVVHYEHAYTFVAHDLAISSKGKGLSR